MSSNQWWRALLPAALLLLPACPTPLSNKIAIGEDAFVIGVGEGPDSMTDLYAAPAGGGSFVRLTFTRPVERFPRLSPSGTRVAFFRRDSGGSAGAWSVVVLDLRNNAERSRTLPTSAGMPEQLGWTPSGDSVIVRAGQLLAMAARGDGGLAPVPAERVSAADSATRELLGDPATAMVRPCRDGRLCIAAADGDTSALEERASDAARWGADSVGYFLPGGFEVRPLAGGHARRPVWNSAPSHLRQITHHPGSPARDR